MPESVSGVDAIIDGLREGAYCPRCGDYKHAEVAPLADAVAAVHAAADARTQEIVDLIRSEQDGYEPSERYAVGGVAERIARRFPNGGTHDG